MIKDPPANAESMRDAGLIPGLGSFPGGGHGNPLQYSCLENPMDRGPWQATIQETAKRQTREKQLNTYATPNKRFSENMISRQQRRSRAGLSLVSSLCPGELS